MDELFMVGAIGVEQKYLTCPSRKLNGQTLYHMAVKADRHNKVHVNTNK